MKELHIYMHIPKTAGTTLRSFVNIHYKKNKILPLYPDKYGSAHDKFKNISSKRKRDSQALIGHFTVDLLKEIQRDFKGIFFIREPVKHVISHYNYLKNSLNPIHKNLIAKHPKLEDFVEIKGWGSNLQSSYIVGYPYFFGNHSDNEIIQEAKNNIHNLFTIIGITEHFSNSLDLVCSDLKIRRKSLPINSKNTGTYDKDKKLSMDLVDKIKYYNRIDIELYNYALERYYDLSQRSTHTKHTSFWNKLIK